MKGAVQVVRRQRVDAVGSTRAGGLFGRWGNVT